jgi:chromosome segregation ATPase
MNQQMVCCFISSVLHSTNFFVLDTTSSPLQREAFDDQEEIRQLRENLVSLTAQLDESNRTWKQYEEAQVDILRNQLGNCLSIDYNGSFDEIAQQIADQVTREREDFSEKYQALERANNDLRSDDNLESIRQSYMNTVNELTQELLAMKEAYDQLDTEKQYLISELEKRPVEVDQDQITRTAGMLSSFCT